MFILITVVVTTVANLKPSQFSSCALDLEKDLDCLAENKWQILPFEKRLFSTFNERYITFRAAGGEKVKINLEGKGKYSSWLQTAGIQSLVSEERCSI